MQLSCHNGWLTVWFWLCRCSTDWIWVKVSPLNIGLNSPLHECYKCLGPSLCYRDMTPCQTADSIIWSCSMSCNKHTHLSPTVMWPLLAALFDTSGTQRHTASESAVMGYYPIPAEGPAEVSGCCWQAANHVSWCCDPGCPRHYRTQRKLTKHGLFAVVT